MRGARMEGAVLYEVLIEGADLRWARMEGAVLYEVLIEGADLRWARMEGADLRWARMEGACLYEARMEGAYLYEARMDNRTMLTAARVSLAAVSTVDYSEVPISLIQVKSMFGDSSVTLPNGITPTHPDWPEHWPKFDLESQFWDEWQKWKANPYTYTPPDPP